VGDERLYEAARILRLLDAPSIGPRRVLHLLQDEGAADRAERSLRAQSSGPVCDFLSHTPLDAYTESLRRTLNLGGAFLLWNEPGYPKNLNLWDARPPVLFIRGTLHALHERALALVGRVDSSAEGVATAARFARRCVENGIVVISGLAKGIDAASHRGALAANASTYAVLGHGLDHAYPKENAALYDVIPTRGALISQFRTGFGPQRWTFPARNEVMCNLALGTVIVEGKPRCGSLIQADFSFKHGRPVFVLGRNLHGGDANWATDLVRRGAHVIERFDQVLDVLDHTDPGQRSSTPLVLFDHDARTTTTSSGSAKAPS
jgi:DNA protecting protein DprA